MPKYKVTLEERVTYEATVEADSWDASFGVAEKLWPELEASEYKDNGIEGPWYGGVEAVDSETLSLKSEKVA